jgi:hypothetical protein
MNFRRPSINRNSSRNQAIQGLSRTIPGLTLIFKYERISINCLRDKLHWCLTALPARLPCGNLQPSDHTDKHSPVVGKDLIGVVKNGDPIEKRYLCIRQRPPCPVFELSPNRFLEFFRSPCNLSQAAGSKLRTTRLDSESAGSL